MIEWTQPSFKSLIEEKDLKIHKFSLVLITFVFFTASHNATETNETSADFDEESIRLVIQREEELWELVRTFFESQRRPDALHVREARRLDKLLKDKTPAERATMKRMYQEFRSRTMAGEEPDLGRFDAMEEVVVIGNILDGIDLDPAMFSMDDINEMRGIRMMANQSYRDGKYDEAYPVLLQLAKRGFKDAQSRLAYIFFNGTDEISKSNLRALGWLGVAAHGQTEPKFRVLFNRYMKEIPDHVRPIVDQVVSAYRESFGHQEHISCSTDHRWRKWSEERVKRTYCQFKLEAIEEACKFECWANGVNTGE